MGKCGLSGLGRRRERAVREGVVETDQADVASQKLWALRRVGLVGDGGCKNFLNKK